MSKKSITLQNIMIGNNRRIGLIYPPDHQIEYLIQTLPDLRFDEVQQVKHIANTPTNVQLLFKTFRGKAWINGKQFFQNRPTIRPNEAPAIDMYLKRKSNGQYRLCPESYLRKLQTRRYAENTVRTYVQMFEKFINHFIKIPINHLDETHIRAYIIYLIEQKKSPSYQNQAINAIKFYYEQVLGMPNRFYEIDRPIKSKELPKVLSHEEIQKILQSCSNLKHLCILQLLYSSGIRRQELLNLKLVDLDFDRKLVFVKSGKGKKDRYTLLSDICATNLKKYMQEYKPKCYVFEGASDKKYSATSTAKILYRAAEKSGIQKKVTPHMMRHSFATHLLEAGTDLRYIQQLMGHGSSQTTEIYTRVALNVVSGIKSPLDSLNLGKNTNGYQQ